VPAHRRDPAWICGFADDLVDFPNKQLVKSGKKLGNCQESSGIYRNLWGRCVTVDIFFEGCQQIEVDLSTHCHLTMETGENNGDIANNFQVIWLG